jgi:hypothetical protein
VIYDIMGLARRGVWRGLGQGTSSDLRHNGLGGEESGPAAAPGQARPPPEQEPARVGTAKGVPRPAHAGGPVLGGAGSAERLPAQG